LPPGHPEGFIEAFAQLYRDFAQDIRLYQSGGIVASRLVPGLDSGIRSLQLIEAALASHRSNGAWVALPPQKNQQETA
jgi:hypothetical protein